MSHLHAAMIGIPTALFLLCAGELAQKAVNGVFTSQSNTAAKNLVIVTSGMEAWDNTLGIKAAFPNSNILHVNATTGHGLLAEIARYTETNGSLNSLVIVSHGRGQRFMPDGAEEDAAGTNTVDMQKFLTAMAEMQENNRRKITNRLVITSCNLFTVDPKKPFTPADRKSYLNLAQRLGTEIVGTTNFYISSVVQTGRFVAFSPNGSVVRDANLDAPYSPIGAFASLLSYSLGYNADWLDANSAEPAHQAVLQTEMLPTPTGVKISNQRPISMQATGALYMQKKPTIIANILNVPKRAFVPPKKSAKPPARPK